MDALRPTASASRLPPAAYLGCRPAFGHPFDAAPRRRLRPRFREYIPLSITVTLEREHLEYCDEIARKRQESADRHDRRGGNGAITRGGAALDMNVKGARGECAAYLWFSPIRWHTYRDDSLADLPDLGDFIDVKTVIHPRPLLIVQPTAPDHWAYLLVNGRRHPDYVLEGWLWGHEVKTPKYLWDPLGGRAAYFVPAADLRPPISLWASLFLDPDRASDTQRLATA